MKFRFLLIFLAIILWPGIVLAQNLPTFSPLTFTAPATDLSVMYLSNLFGVVDGVLNGTSSQLLGQLFGVFNSAVLVLAGIIVMYTLMVSTLNTAHEGDVMGKNWSSIWIPLRSAMGIALLIPKATGYSFIQIFMMWVIVQGVGAADSIWNAALNYLSTGGVIIQANQNISNGTTGSTSGPSSSLVNTAANLLQSLTCTYMLQQELNNAIAYQNQNSLTPNNPVPNFFGDIANAFNSAGTNATINLPTSGYYNTDGVCGSITWQPVNAANLPSYMKDSNGNILAQYQSAVQTVQTSRTQAVYAMVSYLEPYAIQIVNNYLGSQQGLGQVTDTSQNPPTWGVNGGGSPLMQPTILRGAATTFTGIMAPTVNLLNNNNPGNSASWINQAEQDGWLMAGKHYYDLIAMNSGVGQTGDSVSNFQVTSPVSDLTTLSAVTDELVYSSNPQFANDLNTLVNNNTDSYTVGPTSPFMQGQITYSNAVNSSSASVNISPTNNGTGSSTGNNILAAFTFGISSIIQGFQNLFQAETSNANPITALANIGSGALSAGFTLQLVLTMLVTVVAFALGAAWGFGFVGSMVTMMIGLMTMLAPIFLALMATGFMLAFYIPMIPFIIFVFASVGWFITCVETMVAAPLVALGIAHPEGKHQLLGQSEPAVMLLVNVFIRPSLMVVGLLVGIMISYVGIWVLNRGFSTIWNTSTGMDIQGLTWIFWPIGYLCIYTLIALQIVQKSFECIYLIADEILKWIGGSHAPKEGAQIQQAQQAIQSGAQQAGATSTKVAGEMAQGGMKAFGKSVGGSLDSLKGQGKWDTFGGGKDHGKSEVSSQGGGGSVPSISSGPPTGKT